MEWLDFAKLGMTLTFARVRSASGEEHDYAVVGTRPETGDKPLRKLAKLGFEPLPRKPDLSVLATPFAKLPMLVEELKYEFPEAPAIEYDHDLHFKDSADGCRQSPAKSGSAEVRENETESAPTPA